jgi:cyclase
MRLGTALLAALAALPFQTAVWAQPATPKGGGNPVGAIRELKPGLYLVPGAGANTEVRVARDGLIVVDGKLAGEANYNDLMAQIRTVSPLPVKTLILTQHHADHSGNNDRFTAAGVEILAHKNLNEQLKTYNSTPKPAPATRAFDQRETVKLSGVEVQVMHFAPGHTGGDAVVYFPDLKVVVLSDIMTPPGTAPLVDYAGGGSALGWISSLDQALKLDFDLAIPGNGEPVTKAQVADYAQRAHKVIDRARELVAAGTPADQLLAAITAANLGLTLRLPQPQGLIDELKR